MAEITTGKILPVYDNEGNLAFPQTHEDAIRTNDDKTLGRKFTELNDKIDGNISKTVVLESDFVALEKTQTEISTSIIPGIQGQLDNIKTYFNKLNAKELGIISGLEDSATKTNNSNILKSTILANKKNVCIRFPKGEYWFDKIDIDDVGNYYEVILEGECQENTVSSRKDTNGVIIRTPNSGFINRTCAKDTGDNSITFIASNIRFIGTSSYSQAPVGMCLGTVNNNGGEYNFIFKNVTFSGYEYGFKSPGWSCGYSRGKGINLNHCIYGIYIESASHFFEIEDIDIGYCKYGIRMGFGGTPCKITNVHVATGVFSGITVGANEKCYAIHVKGGVVIDGIYHENYSGLDLSNYTLIDYEGLGMGSLAKLVIKNAPIGYLDGSHKGMFFTGATFVGAGIEMGATNPLRVSGNDPDYFADGCVEFYNCIPSGTKSEIKAILMGCVSIYDGLNNAYGYDFVGSYFEDNDMSLVKLYSNLSTNKKTLIGGINELYSEMQSIIQRLNILESGKPAVYGQIVLNKSTVSITEGSSGTFTVALDKAPTNNQIVTLSKTNVDVSLSSTSLTFTPSNYDKPQTVTITVAEDNTDYSNETDIITLTSPNVQTKKVDVAITDNDIDVSQIDTVDIFTGNAYETQPIQLEKGYVYTFTPQTSCTWNNPSVETAYDTTAETGKYTKEINVRGYFKVKTIQNSVEVNTPVTFTKSNVPRWYSPLVKREGKNDVLILGDSLTDVSFTTFDYNYVSQLITNYKDKYNLNVQWAKYGETTDLQKASCTKFVNTHLGGSDYNYGVDLSGKLSNVKYVSIFTGTNEINQDVDLTTFETNYNAIIDYIKTNLTQAKILCITPFLCCKKSTNINYINKIKEIAATKGCSVCDLSTFTELDSVTNGYNQYYLEEECIHLSEAGWNLVNPKIIQSFENLSGFTS